MYDWKRALKKLIHIPKQHLNLYPIKWFPLFIITVWHHKYQQLHQEKRKWYLFMLIIPIFRWIGSTGNFISLCNALIFYFEVWLTNTSYFYSVYNVINNFDSNRVAEGIVFTLLKGISVLKPFCIVFCFHHLEVHRLMGLCLAKRTQDPSLVEASFQRGKAPP